MEKKKKKKKERIMCRGGGGGRALSGCRECRKGGKPSLSFSFLFLSSFTVHKVTRLQPYYSTTPKEEGEASSSPLPYLVGGNPLWLSEGERNGEW